MRRLMLAATAITLSYSAPSHAQGDPRLANIEAQIRSLQNELSRVRRDLATRDREVRNAREAAARTPAAPTAAPAAAPSTSTSASTQPSATPPPAPAATASVSLPAGRPTWTSSDGRYSASIGAQLHFDVGGYLQSDEQQPDNRNVNRLNTFGQNVRRARLPIILRADQFQVTVTPDFGGSPDGTPSLYEGSIAWSPNRNLSVGLGYYKPLHTLNDSTSSNNILFLERPAIVNIASSLAAGSSRATFGARYSNDRFLVAGYLTGDVYGSQSAAVTRPQSTGGVFRAAVRPFYNEDIDVHLGVSTNASFRIRRTAAGQSLQLRDRPELRVDNNRLIDTGLLNASGAYSYGPEFAFRYDRLMVQGEYIRVGVDRDGPGPSQPGLEFEGGYVEGSYVILGQPRAYSTSSAAFGSVRLRPEQRVGQGGFGGLEAVARYSVVNLDDRVTRGRSAVSTGGVYGGYQQVIGVGLNWYPNENFRLMLDYDNIRVDRLNAAGTAQIGQNIQAIAVRAQAAF